MSSCPDCGGKCENSWHGRNIQEAHEWNEDQLEPRVGRVVTSRHDVFRVHGCKPRRGDWLRIRGYDLLVISRTPAGELSCFPPPWRVSGGVHAGDEVTITASGVFD